VCVGWSLAGPRQRHDKGVSLANVQRWCENLVVHRERAGCVKEGCKKCVSVPGFVRVCVL
jgi:hypothetical protein